MKTQPEGRTVMSTEQKYIAPVPYWVVSGTKAEDQEEPASGSGLVGIAAQVAAMQKVVASVRGELGAVRSMLTANGKALSTLKEKFVRVGLIRAEPRFAPPRPPLRRN